MCFWRPINWPSVGSSCLNGQFCIAETGDGLDAVAAFHAVFNGDGHHAAGGEVFTLLLKLFRASAIPTSAEEKEDRRGFIVRFVAFRFEDVQR